MILLGTAFIAGVGFLAIQLFETKKITVTGNQYVSEQEVIDWLFNLPTTTITPAWV